MRHLALMLLLLAPASAFALDMDFVTYNAFEETVAAFQRLALFMSDPAFMVITSAIIVLSLVFGAAMTAGQAHSGQGANIMGLLVPLAIGIAIFMGTVVPKGTVYIYDPVRNKTQAVGDVPDMIVLLAGMMSDIEESIIGIVDTASANPYGDNAGALSYTFLLSALGTETADINLENSISQYYTDCVQVAYAVNYNGITKSELVRQTASLRDTLAKANHPTWPTMWWPTGNDGGVTGSCGQSWTYISSSLSPSVTDPMVKRICEKAGFDTTGGSTSLAQCDSLIADTASVYGIVGATSSTFLANFLIARNISNALSSEDYGAAQRTMVNRQVMAESFGANEAMGQWVPRLRGFMLAIALGIAPICLMFVATPLVWRSLAMFFGLFMWLTMWGICDAMSSQMSLDAAYDAFSQIREKRVSFEAMMATPEAAVQALGIFGKARSMALLLATTLCAGLFKFGGYAFTSMAQGWQQHLDQVGERAGRDSMLSEERARMQQALTQAPGVQGALGQYGFKTMSDSSGRSGMHSGAYQGYIDQKVEGGSFGFTQDQAHMEAGSVQGQRNASGTIAGMRGLDGVGGAMSEVAGAQHLGSGSRVLSEQDTANRNFQGGFVGKSEFDGRDAVARDATRSKVAGEFGGNGQDFGSLAKLSSQENAAVVGAIRATDGKPDAYAGMAETSTRIDLARTDEQRGSEDLIGGTQGDMSVYQATSQRRVEDTLGGTAITEGMTVNQAQHARVGAHASAMGGSVSVGAEFGDQQFATQMAAARISKDIAAVTGHDPNSIRDRVDVSQRQQGYVMYSMSEGERDHFAQLGEKAGMSPAQIDALRSGEGPATVRFAYADGQLGNFSVDDSSDVRGGNTVHQTEGTRTDLGDRITAGDSVRVADGAAFRRDNAVKTIQELVPNAAEGSVSDTQMLAVANAYAERLGAEGFTGTAQRMDTEQSQTQVGGGFKVGGKGSAIGKAMDKIGVGGSVDLGHTNTTSGTDTRSMSQDFIKTGFLGDVQDNLAEARAAVYEQLGTPEQWDSNTRDQANSAVTERWALLNEQSVQNLKIEQMDHTGEQAALAQGAEHTTMLGGVPVTTEGWKDLAGDAKSWVKEKLGGDQ